MMVAVIEWEPLARLFHTTPLGWQDWLLAAVLGLTHPAGGGSGQMVAAAPLKTGVIRLALPGWQADLNNFDEAAMYKTFKSVILVGLITAILISLLEVFLFITVRFPVVNKVLPGIITKISRRIYVYYDMKIPTFMPEGGRFDSTLGYTLRPGRFFFSINEGTVECRINRLGVRDTEAALDSPQIIVLGDSYAWGWGKAGGNLRQNIRSKDRLKGFKCRGSFLRDGAGNNVIEEN